KVPIRTVCNYRLAWRQPRLHAIDQHGHEIRFKRDEIRDTADFGVRLTIGPGRLMRVANVVVAAQALIWTEGLMVHGAQRRLVDVGARHVPPWREAGLVEHERSP